MKLYTDIIKENNFHNAWSTIIHRILRNGTEITIGDKTERKPIYDSCMVVELTGNAIKQIIDRELHPQYPFRNIDQYCEEYTYRYLEEYLKKPEEERFAYLYFERLALYNGIHDQILMLFNQLSEQKKDNVTSNRCQAITWYPSDLDSKSPPCLQRIQLRYLPTNKVDVRLNWRSRDAYGAWQANIIALVGMINELIVKPNNCSIANIVDYSDSLHIYKNDEQVAEKVKNVPVSPQEMLR